MPKTTSVQTNFTAGELSPLLHGRVDISRYQNGAEVIENAWPVVQGGCSRRWGLAFEAAAKHAGKRARLIPFIASRQLAHMLEVGEGYVRVFKPDGPVLSGGAPVEIASPYTEQQVQELDWTPIDGAMILWHPNVAPQRLRRFADDKWVLDAVPWNPAPFDEIGFRPAAGMTLSATTPGTGRTLTASAPTFLASDVGRDVWAGSGVGTITAVGSATSATITILVEFDAAAYSAPAWQVRGSPLTNCTPSATGPEGAGLTLTLSSDGWRPEDVGKHVAINNGLARITAYTSPTQVQAVVVFALNTTVAAVPYAWGLNAPVWNAQDGYPSTGTRFQQRLLAAGSPGFPQRVWGSPVSQPIGMLMGPNEDDGFDFTLDSDEVSPISYLYALEAVVALGYSSETTLEGGIEKPLTRSNVRARPRSNHGCERVRPVRVGNEELFVQRGGTRVRALSYDADAGRWSAPDVSVLAEHLLRSGVRDLTWQGDKAGLLMAVRNDGWLATATYDRDQDVVAWARHVTGAVRDASGNITAHDAIESVATIPAGDTEQTWVIVRRTVGGSAVRYVERFDASLHVDSGITGESVGGTATWGGLAHLNGRTVDIVADGSPMPRMTVAGGQITLPRPAKSVQIGLPYRSRIRTLTPEGMVPGVGSAQGSAMDMGEVWVNLLQTIGCTVNGQTIPFRQFGPDVLNQPPQPYTGLKRVENLGWANGDSQVEIVQDQPLPWHVRSVIRKWTFNQG